MVVMPALSFVSVTTGVTVVSVMPVKPMTELIEGVGVVLVEVMTKVLDPLNRFARSPVPSTLGAKM